MGNLSQTRPEKDFEEKQAVNKPIEKEILFDNGVLPKNEDFKETKTVPAKLDPDGEILEPEKTVTEDVAILSGTDAKGNQVKYVLLSDKRIATIREGKGSDVEKVQMEVAEDKSKYLSAMIASCTSIEGKQVNMYSLAKLKMKDYSNLQIAFAEINF